MGIASPGTLCPRKESSTSTPATRGRRGGESQAMSPRVEKAPCSPSISWNLPACRCRLFTVWCRHGMAGPPVPLPSPHNRISPQWMNSGTATASGDWERDGPVIWFNSASRRPRTSHPCFLPRASRDGWITCSANSEHRPVFPEKSEFAPSANTNPIIEQYLALQQRRGDFAEARYRATLAEFSREFPKVDLEDPSETGSGRYWYNLHLVAVTNGRFRMGKEDYLPRLAAEIPKWVREERALLRSMALMAEHVHLALRGDPARSPGEIAEGFYRTMNRAAGLRLFSERIYVGSFSSYSTRLIGL